jgi:hypothetical protein
LAEETGLQVPTDGFIPCGYERITVAEPGHWAANRPLVQVFRAEQNIARPTVVPGDDVDEAHWVSHDEFRDRCRERFWWPLAAFVLDLGP